VEPPHYLGATIVAQKDRPVRVKFYNLLPTGAAGNLFIPVDTTVMGSGMTAQGHMMDPTMMDPLKPMCSEPGKEMDVAAGDCYADNRATLHLHGGISPWISDGTPHQWITPAGENTPYPQGVSVVAVPDMGDSGDPTDGVMTFYYTNQQSARLMFYHDHAWGITRLNVYAGEASGYLLRDATEQSLVDLGLIPADEIPLIIQDKTFVPDMTQLMQQDETWDVARWGGEGSLWVPHVYSPAQNPGDSSGVNPSRCGRCFSAAASISLRSSWVASASTTKRKPSRRPIGWSSTSTRPASSSATRSRAASLPSVRIRIVVRRLTKRSVSRWWSASDSRRSASRARAPISSRASTQSGRWQM
jgi:hypothetical protein